MDTKGQIVIMFEKRPKNTAFKNGVMDRER